ncbi:MAG: endolytic transglycosylase MltG [Prevotella sp.]|jgi:UPF0755 protein|nr:endolytic transglycosylase MltG [Prevotella sp.]
MSKKKKKNTWLKVVAGIVVLLGLAILCPAYYFLKTSMLTKEETQYIYVDRDDNIDSVYVKLDSITTPQAMKGFKFVANYKDLASSLKRGRYAVDTKTSAWDFFNTLKRGEQTPLNVPIPSARTMDKLAVAVSKKLELDSLELLSALTDSTVCAHYGFTLQTIPAMFIPDSYNMYWTVSVNEFLDRMKKEFDNYWNDERKSKAKALGLSPVEVSTLASIVTEETRATKEKPTVAGLYLNRLKKGMLLQSDPTVKFAMQDFGVRRILNRMLTIDNRYNTYKYAGLPPGPIRIPLKEDLEAVLNPEKHDYIYMCAKEDFSGTHNYARTEAEHRANAAKYHKALNERGIR